MLTAYSLLCLSCSPANVDARTALAPSLPSMTAAQPDIPETAIAQAALSEPDRVFASAAQYSGEIGTLEGDRAFSEFLFANDGTWVNLDVYISENSDNYGEDWFSLCAEATAEAGCPAISVNYVKTDVEALFLGEADGVRTLEGYWQVQVNPGMHQGFLSISLLAIP